MKFKRLFKRLLTLSLAVCMVAVTAFSGYADDGGLKLPSTEQADTGKTAAIGLSSINDETDIEKLSADELVQLLLEMSVKIDAEEMSVDAFISMLPAINSKILPLIKDSDFITIAKNKDYPESFRFLFLDFYPLVTTPNTSEYNNTLKLIAEDSSESSFIRTNAATSMSDDNEKAEVMYALYTDVTEYDKAILMKQLSLLKPEMANELSKEVLSDYESYDKSLVGLANKTLVRTMQGSDDKEMILNINKEFLAKNEAVYTQTALFALTEMKDPDAVNLVFQAADFDNRALQTFVKKNFNLVTDYLATAPIEETSRCITAVPIKEFKEYLLKNSRSSSALPAADTEKLLKDIETYNSPILISRTMSNDYKDYPGAVLYRDNVAIIEWHAAIVCDGPKDGEDFAQATGGTSDVEFATYDKFLGSGTCQGIYLWGNMTTAEQTDITNMAKMLTSEGIHYSINNMMTLWSAIGLGEDDWIEPNKISEMRCDGFVEYVYEYNGLKLQGVPNDWNIAIMRGWRKHNGILMRPTTQANVPFFKVIEYIP